MKYLLSIVIIIEIIFFTACIDRTEKMSFKDSVTAYYIKYRDSLGEPDTAENNYKVLKAYVNDDTVFLKELLLRLQIDKHQALRWSYMDTCVHQQKLQDMDVDEAYRFVYAFAFSRYKHNITVIKKGDSITLHYIKYEYEFDKQISSHIITVYDVKLSKKNWDDFEEAIYRADFWGLKKDNGFHGVDGDDVIVAGYSHTRLDYGRKAKFNLVSRWNVNYSTLEYPLQLAFKFAGVKEL